MLSDLLEEVLELQKSYTSSKTSAMERRGLLIRSEIPQILRQELPSFQAAPDVEIADLVVEGKDGIGTKSEIPWVRLNSKSMSPTATQGWYVVFLFSATGSNCFLTLGHASTTYENEFGISKSWRALDPKVAEQLMDWGKKKLNLDGLHPRLEFSKDLEAKGPLGRAYDRTGLCDFRYEAGEVPDDQMILGDISFLLGLLTRIHGFEQSDPTMPGTMAPETQEALIAVTEAAGRRSPVKRRSGQGFGLSKPEKDAVELWAIKLATAHLESLGYREILDVGKTHSYDLEIKTPEGLMAIEVKGTTSHGESVILTPNEVRIQRECFPKNALVVVSEILLTRGDSPIASGGVLRYFSPWQIDEADLAPAGFVYSLPSKT